MEEMNLFEAPFRPASSMAELVEDILETYRWEYWTPDQLAFEAARIRGQEAGDPQIRSMRRLCQSLVSEGRAEGRLSSIVRDAAGRSIVYTVLTVKWKEAV